MWLLAIFLLSSACNAAIVETIDHSVCHHVVAARWKAEITLSKPLQLIHFLTGEVTFVSDDGKYIEVVGRVDPTTSLVCVKLSGNYTGHQEPKVHIEIKPLVKETDLVQRQLRSLRFRRQSTEIWRVSSVPQSSSISSVLSPFQPYHHKWGDDSMSASTKHSTNPALAIHYAQGTYSQSSSTRGVGFFTTPNELPDGVDQLILMYDMYFENFGWGNMGKLPGLYGGVDGEGAYQCSGGNNPSTCFSLRMMWRKNGDGELYAYIPSNQESGFNSRPDVIANSDYGQSIGRGKIKFQNGAWNTVLQHVHLNTVGKTDGYVKFCNQVQGQEQQCYTATNLRMRNSASHYIRGIFFSTFFGGSNPADAAPNDCHTYFKELRLKFPSGVVVG